MPVYNDLKSTNTAYFPRKTVSGQQIITWDLQNVVPNVWDTMIDSIPTWLEDHNANSKSLSNLTNLSMTGTLTITGGSLTTNGNFTMTGTRPTVALDQGASARARVMQIASQARIDFLANLGYDGANWQRDDIAQSAAAISMTASNGQILFRYAAAGANPATVSNPFLFDLAGGSIVFGAMPTANPGAGTKKLWADPADSYRVKFAN